MEEKVLGKIGLAEFGRLHDRPYLFGLVLGLETNSSSVMYDKLMNMSKSLTNEEWEKDRKDRIFEINDFIFNLLIDAKVNTIDELIGIPVEMTFEQSFTRKLKSFRILKEVL